MQNFSFYKCEFIPKEDIWATADSYRGKLWQNSTLPVDMDYVIEISLELDINPISEMLVPAFLNLGFEEVWVDNRMFNDQRWDSVMRFALAHEVGHYILHDYVFDGIQFSSTAEYIEFQQQIPEKEYRRFEYQANQFAGRFLVPTDRLVQEVNDVGLKIQAHGYSHLIQDDAEQVLQSVSPALCRPFGVSEEVIERRVQEEKLWPPQL